jgi:hypothetical protein
MNTEPKTVVNDTKAKTAAALNDNALIDYEHKPFTRADFIREQKQSKSNKVELGCDLVDIESKVGSERKDKDGHVQIGHDNMPLLYPTKFHATFTFMGGTIKTEINLVQFESLKVGSTYFCKGRIATVKDFGKESLAPVFSEFIELYVDEEE